jgi:hypothetical protein
MRDATVKQGRSAHLYQKQFSIEKPNKRPEAGLGIARSLLYAGPSHIKQLIFKTKALSSLRSTSYIAKGENNYET